MKPTAVNNANTIFWAGIALAAGASGVVIASVFYGLSPVSAALPTPGFSLANSISGMLAGRVTMMAAGTVGIFFDVILAAGALVLLVFRPPASLQIERMGWAFVALSVLIFTAVDSLSAGVLTQLAALDGGATAFAGFKLLFDTLFVLGTIAFGLGIPAILISEMSSCTPVMAKPLLWAGILISVAGLVSALLYFAQVSLPQVIGLSIAGGSLIFAIYGIQIARSIRKTAL
jgi:hypothetical protein